MISLPNDAGLVLDLDDTLYPERSFHESGIRWIVHKIGLDPEGSAASDALDALREPNGRPLDLLSRSTGLPVSKLLDWHRSHFPNIVLYPDALGLVARATSLQVPMVLLTDGRSLTQRNKIAALGISEAFRATLISEETGFSKESGRAFAHAETFLHDRPQIVYFGDNPLKDIRAPLELGWEVYLMEDRGDNVHPQGGSHYGVSQLRDFTRVGWTVQTRLNGDET